MASSSWKYLVDCPPDDDGHLPVEDGTFDGVLSIQVLEHVPNPAAYLHEAMPVLRPGGRLVRTTHGVWEDHGPVDLFRWIAEGLTAEVTAAGYTVDQCLISTAIRTCACAAPRAPAGEHGFYLALPVSASRP